MIINLIKFQRFMNPQLFKTYLQNISIGRLLQNNDNRDRLNTTLGELAQCNDFLLFYIISSSTLPNQTFLRALYKFIENKSHQSAPKRNHFNATTSPTKFKRLLGLKGKKTIEADNPADKNANAKSAISVILVDIELQTCEANLSFLSEFGLFYLPPQMYLSKCRLLRALNFVNAPSLIVMNCAELRVISQCYRSLMDDQEGDHFPWPSPLPSELFKTDLLKNSTHSIVRVDFNAMEKGVRGLFFGAKWCPPSRQMCKQLSELYPKLKEHHPEFEIIFCSYDRSEDSFRENFASMPWLALPYGTENPISKAYDIHGIPTFLLLDENYSVISRNGFNLIREPDDYPWKRKALYELNEFTVHLLSEMPSLILFTEGSPEDTEFSIQFLNSCVQWIHGLSESQAQERETTNDLGLIGEDRLNMCDSLQVFYTGEDPICDYVLESLGQEQADLPLLIICNTLAGHVSICDKPNVSEEILIEFVNDYRAGRAKIEPMPNHQPQQQTKTVAGIPTDILQQLVIQQQPAEASQENQQFHTGFARSA